MRHRLVTLALILAVVAFFAAPRGQALAADPPVVTGVSPNTGTTNGGTTIQIFGSGFQFGGSAFVSIGGVLAKNVAVLNASQISATIPPGVAGTALPVMVINPDGQSSSLPSAFTYTTPLTTGNPGGMWIAGISPPTGDPGTVVHVTGALFDPNATASFSGVPSPSLVWIHQGYVMVSVPAGAPAGPITITNPSGQSAVSPTNFTPNSTTATNTGGLVISSVAPTSTTAGNAIAISGAGFIAGATVTVGGFPALNVTVPSSTVITATAPAGPSGLATVVVTNPGGASVSFTGIVYPGTTTTTTPTTTGGQPSVASVSPNVGSSVGGTIVSISGSGFVAPATVTFGGVPATLVTVVNSNLITATTPANPVGPVSVLVSGPSGSVGGMTSGFTYELAWPRLTSVSPSTGALTGGTTLTLVGSGFAPGATVTIGGIPAPTVSSVSPTQIVVTSPAGASGAAVILVTNPGGAIAGLANAFSFSANPQPVAPPPTPVTTGVTITGVSPSTGPSAGGTLVFINGTGFVSGATVTVSGITVPATVLSSTQISTTTPAVTGTGSVTVTVMNPGASSATALPSAFTYTAGGSSTGGTTTTTGAGGASTTVPAGGGLFVFGGGSNQQLLTASGCSASTAVFWTTDSKGAWIGYIPSVPVAVVNAAWTSLFPTGIPAGTPIFARC